MGRLSNTTKEFEYLKRAEAIHDEIGHNQSQFTLQWIYEFIKGWDSVTAEIRFKTGTNNE